ncbi:MAG: response regulator [Candidatus Omnitrophica bacterium CG11_big_fil_rev_8_21_14_0_20_45_26]|uniref:Response regulator n=1 Tax=Candidatus Abzuiibacterium crystallinum TaxID=1974748 RepID=A0A2H0LPT8_9BACT|nr:MAG: response regulator [Candidatus Omnitrophica bacterium CG11_big_fil_rev_8_21_14_0_20_45_26]PIW65624.1 MAG: response regulator [Candidatus Omnitrophica bacterium CG12_big_fil_rev_8_21_14_0_65_45_16]
MAKLLVVDDEVDVCSELAELLEEDDHLVHCAENAVEAFEKVKTNEYDVIFLDVLMPKIEGSEALIEIKKVTDTPVVVMSAYMGEDVQKQVLNAGAYLCLKKPFKIKEIKDILTQVVQEKKKSKS